MPQKRKKLNIEGTNLWYLVGLITSDGNLSKDGRHVDITAKDRYFLRTITAKLGLANKIGIKNKDTYKEAHRLQISNKNFYDFLLSIGLRQNKSLILGALHVPNRYFMDFLRGVIDGDGCIRNWIHPTNRREQWSLRIYSGSEKFISWLSDEIAGLLEVFGKIYNSRENLWVLKYGKMAAREIIRRCYYKNCFGLKRKIKLARDCCRSYSGWTQSKTVVDCYRRDGETGKRTGLKIPRPQGLVGSIPSPGTFWAHSSVG